MPPRPVPPPADATTPASGPRRRWLVPAAVVAGLSPLAKTAVDAVGDGLGANPVEAALNRLGFWALTFLALALLPTPAKDLLGLSWPNRLRRTLGLLAFSYALLHFCFYVGVDKFFDVRTIAADLTKRPFIMVGFATLLMLVPLAVTSTDGWVRRLGFARWKWIHRLVYAAAALAVVHFLWRVKADRTRPLLFAAAFAVLLAARVPGWVRSAASTRRRAAGPARGRAARPPSR